MSQLNMRRAARSAGARPAHTPLYCVAVLPAPSPAPLLLAALLSFFFWSLIARAVLLLS